MAKLTDRELDPMTVIYELDPYSLLIHQMCENELSTSSLSNVIILQPANYITLEIF